MVCSPSGFQLPPPSHRPAQWVNKKEFKESNYQQDKNVPSLLHDKKKQEGLSEENYCVPQEFLLRT